MRDSYEGSPSPDALLSVLCCLILPSLVRRAFIYLARMKDKVVQEFSDTFVKIYALIFGL